MFTKHSWLPLVLPLVVFMAVGMFEPSPPAADGTPASGWLDYEHYPAVYTLKIVLTSLAILIVWPALRQFPCKRPSPWAFVIGLAGGAVWIALAQWQIEATLLESLGLATFLGLGERAAFNPFEQMADAPDYLVYGFLAVRLFGLVVVIAIAEEVFLRGFLMRYLTDPDWQKVGLGEVSTAAIVAGTLVPMLMHPGELLAAAVWFSAVTWLMLRTRNLWDCVAAHMLTNLSIGVYVLAVGTPEAWRLM